MILLRSTTVIRCDGDRPLVRPLRDAYSSSYRYFFCRLLLYFIKLLYRLAEDEEDRSLAGKAASSDNVALMVLLQPWQDSAHPLGACVVCTQLHDEQSRSGDAVRSLQARGITRTIEAFNADFQLPVILCGTMNCVPCSGTYQILCKGVEAQDPDIPGPPGKPVAVPLSTSSAHLWWAPPLEDNEALSPPVDLYKLVWIPGGSRFLGGESVDVLESDCLVYGLVETDSGNVRSEQNPLRSYIVTGLSSGVAYEFRVAAINELGQGRWSERSEAIRMPRMVGNDPEDRVLLGAASIKVLRERELEESLRRMAERLADPRAYELRKLVKFDGLVDLGAEKVHPFDSVSGMTPRYSDALLHPDVANVRADTGYPIIEPASEGGSSVGASTATGRRRRRRRKIAACESRSDTFSAGDRDSRNTCSTGQTTRADAASGDRRDDLAGVDIEKGGVDRASCCGDVISDEGSIGTRAWHAGEGVDATGITEEDTESLNVPTACRASSMEEEKSDDHNKQAGCSATTTTTTVVSRREADAVARLASLNVSGARSDRQRHALGLRSAYMSHWSGGEPAFTTLSDTVSATVDYIFFSADCLLPGEVLSLPEMGSLLGRDVQQTELAPTPGCWTPSEWQGTADEEGFAGEWCPYLGENPRRVRHRIPNDTFPSDHLMLAANLYFSEAFCPSTWQP